MDERVTKTCDLYWLDTVFNNITEHLTDLKGNCSKRNCNFPSSDGFKSSAPFDCDNKLHRAFGKTREQSGYSCACDDLKLTKPLGSIDQACTDACVSMPNQMRCAVVYVELNITLGDDTDPEFFTISEDGPGRVTKSECATLRCGDDVGSVLESGRGNSTKCTNSAGSQPFECDGQWQMDYFDVSKRYVCNCAGPADASESVSSPRIQNGGVRDDCEGKYGKVGTVTGSSASATGSSKASSGSNPAAFKLSLKNVVGFATLSLFTIGLMA